MVHQLALIIAGKTVAAEEVVAGADEPPPPLSERATLLFSFETAQEIQQWQPTEAPDTVAEMSDGYATEGNHALRVVFPHHIEYPEVDTTAIPNNWSPYQIFAFDVVYNPDDPETTWMLGVRIEDADMTHEKQPWFQTDAVIRQGVTTLRIAVEEIGQAINVTDIQRLMLYTYDLDRDLEAYIDNMRFEMIPAGEGVKPFVMSFEEQPEVNAWQPTNEDRRITLNRAEHHATHGSYTLQATLPKTSSRNEYPGMFTKNLPRDWSPYAHFTVDVYLERPQDAPSVLCGIRIDDADSTSYESRFNGEVWLAPGLNTIRIPLEQVSAAIDLRRIRAVYLFLDQPEKQTTLYVDHIRVE
jgi:hypothetical protein